ncbi:hypothetical protein [uncultured Microbulbifer sp.]|uniref:hypothetical protein n=1 Tax=uncultured Microbulbifer sp. TaxID=348147 RepID=UPI0026023E40|nr:hypothetical protein [uncultured Microbulbifer sp.]
MKTSINKATVRATRIASYLFPTLKITIVRDREKDWWNEVCIAVRERCRNAYERRGCLENPYPAGDLRRWEWIQESHAIIHERLQSTLNDVGWAEEIIYELGAAKRGEIIPFPQPDKEPQKEAAKQKVNWECEDIYV